MEVLSIISGVVTFIKEDKTKDGKKFFKYQIESNGENGKRLGYVKSYEDRGLKVGDKLNACGFMSASLFNGKVYENIVLLKMEEEKQRLAALGIKTDTVQKTSQKMAV